MHNVICLAWTDHFSANRDKFLSKRVYPHTNDAWPVFCFLIQEQMTHIICSGLEQKLELVGEVFRISFLFVKKRRIWRGLHSIQLVMPASDHIAHMKRALFKIAHQVRAISTKENGPGRRNLWAVEYRMKLFNDPVGRKGIAAAQERGDKQLGMKLIDHERMIGDRRIMRNIGIKLV